MSAKDKAEELLKKMLGKNPNRQDGISRIDVIQAKQCALICIDEMLDFRNCLYINEGSLAHQWLLDVKQEIEKL